MSKAKTPEMADGMKAAAESLTKDSSNTRIVDVLEMHADVTLPPNHHFTLPHLIGLIAKSTGRAVKDIRALYDRELGEGQDGGTHAVVVTEADAIVAKDFLAFLYSNKVREDKAALDNLRAKVSKDHPDLVSALKRDEAKARALMKMARNLQFELAGLAMLDGGAFYAERIEIDAEGFLILVAEVRKKGKRPQRKAHRICTPLVVEGEGVGASGGNASVRVSVRGKFGFPQWATVSIRRDEMVARGGWQKKIHADNGTVLDEKAALKLLQVVKSEPIPVVEMHGWQYDTKAIPFDHEDACSLIMWGDRAFTCGLDESGKAQLTEVAVVPTGEFDKFAVSGTLDEWKKNVGAKALNEPSLAFRMIMSGAATYRRPVGVQGGATHTYGPSGGGKTAEQKAVVSLTGEDSLAKIWDISTTDFSNLGRKRNDATVWLRDANTITKKTIAESASGINYAFGEGKMPGRGNRDGSSRKTHEFATYGDSDGENKFDILLKRHAVELTPGGETRMPNLRREASGSLDYSALAESTRRYHGTAMLESLRLTMGKPGHENRKAMKATYDQFTREVCQADSVGQVERVAQSFAIGAAWGELMIANGVLPWSKGYAYAIAKLFFEQWIAEQRDGSHGSVETFKGRKNYIETFAAARGVNLQDISDPTRVPPRTLWGYYRSGEEYGGISFEVGVYPKAAFKRSLRDNLFGSAVSDLDAVLKELKDETIAAVEKWDKPDFCPPPLMLMTDDIRQRIQGKTPGAQRKTMKYRVDGVSKDCIVLAVPSALVVPMAAVQPTHAAANDDDAEGAGATGRDDDADSADIEPASVPKSRVH